MLSFWAWAELERKQLKKGEIPQHVAIIMDGNGTWAKRRGLPRNAGHARGAEALRKTLKEAAHLGVKYLSVYAFSTENWKRPKEEVEYLMNLFLKSLKKETPSLIQNKVQLKFLGELSSFSKELRELMISSEKDTANTAHRIQLNVLVNYGSRNEIKQAVNKAIQNGTPLVKETDFDKYLYTAGMPDPDLLIRTSGQLRISNFLLWQIAYAELWITKMCWPDFDGKTLRQAIKAYQARQRRRGGL